jgi:hypothetical protein
MQRPTKIALGAGKGIFNRLCYNSASTFGFPRLVPSKMRRSEIQGERLHLLRPFLALMAVGAFLAAMVLPVRIQAALGQQDNKQQDAKQQDTKDTKAKQDNKEAEKPNPKEKFTAEQIVESVIFLYGSRPMLDQIRRYGVERGKITHYPAEGNPDEANYERRFVRGENLDKDKIRLDQKLPTMEYSLIFDDGKLWGLINGAAFTPRQDATASFISQHHHSLDTLLRYKECGSTLTLVGKDQQKGLELYVVDLTDKDKRKTRFYISARSLRVLWLEYEEGPAGGVPVKYTRKFLDYRIVQQTLAPYRTVLLENGRESQVTNVLTITYGVKVSDSIFKNPEG